MAQLVLAVCVLVAGAAGSLSCPVNLSLPHVALQGVPFSVDVSLPPFLSAQDVLPPVVLYDCSNGSNCSCHETRPNGTAQLIFQVSHTVHSLGHHTVAINLTGSDCCSCEANETELCVAHKRIYSIPAVLTLLPPVLTAVVAIVFRQVILALLLGIWLCAFFANEYNPLTAVLRALDTYFVDAIATPGNAKIIVFAFFLGGLIGAVQRSGGGLGMAQALHRFTGTRRRACIVCVVLCLLIFFDDYSCVLIAGNSLRTVMSGAGVSKDKFAFLLQSVGPAVPSVVPISSWVGVEVGYVQSALSKCSEYCRREDPFLVVLRTLPYRFFPLLMVVCVVIVAVLARDFGPMLGAERSSLPPPPPPPASSADTPEEVEMNSHSATEAKSEDGFSGPLSPKPGVPHRWINAVLPFLVAVLATVLGMVLGGRQAILDMPHNTRPPMTVLNIFRNCNSLNALLWASFLACAVAMVMLLVQRILSLKEFMEAWVEGIKDIMEPLIVLFLAWGLGFAIEDIQTSNFIAQLLKGGVSSGYIPALVCIIGFLISFATGSAFGTMGILFPLVLPTVCKLTDCEQTAIVQATAAILSSSIFGNVISPIADITILTTVASQCNLNSHLKTAFLYVVVVGVVSVLFGCLPVGAGWYPWWAAWMIMGTILASFFLLFSSSYSSPTSTSLCWKGCRCVYHTSRRLYKRPSHHPAQETVDEKSPLIQQEKSSQSTDSNHST